MVETEFKENFCKSVEKFEKEEILIAATFVTIGTMQTQINPALFGVLFAASLTYTVDCV